MPRLYFKGMQDHMNAYKHEIADEATNDLILGAKVNAYTGLEEAKTKAIDEIAITYGKFLKALKTKEIGLANAPKIVAEKIAELEKKDKSLGSVKSSNMSPEEIMRLRSGLRQESIPPTESLTDTQSLATYKDVLEYAIRVVDVNRNIFSALSESKKLLSQYNGLDKNLETVLHDMGYAAGKRGATSQYKPLTKDILKHGLQALIAGVSVAPK